MNKRAGMPEAEARLAARRTFGNLSLLKEKTREADLPVFFETFLKDVGFATRMLAKHPGFTLLAVLALGIGIGVNTAVFTACKAVLLEPLDAKDPGQLANVYRSTDQRPYDPSFSCLGIPLVVGHTFAPSPVSQDPTMILSQSAAAEFWPGEKPIGKRVALDASNQSHDRVQLIPQGTVYEVIAVARNTRAITPDGGDNRKAYLSLPADRADTVPVLIRFTGNSKGISLDLGKRLHALDPNLIVYAETLEGLLTSTPTFVITRLAAIFASLIGGLGLLLACIGVYGAVGYAVARRTREVGIRMALGARKADVLRLIVLESSRPVLVGLTVGIVAAAGASRVLQLLLFGLGSLDPVAFGGVGSLFLLISLLAAYLPARGAAKVDPALALRCE